MANFFASLNWYLYKNTEGVFEDFWSHIVGYLKDYKYNLTGRCFNKTLNINDLINKKSLGLGQICGLNLPKKDPSVVNYVGSFVSVDHEIKPGFYRSVIIKNKNNQSSNIENLEAIINEIDSYSGRFSLYHYFNKVFIRPNFKLEILSGSHLETIKLINSKINTVGAIDYLSWFNINKLSPDLTKNIKIIGFGMAMPSPPLICSTTENRNFEKIIQKAVFEVFNDLKIKKAFNNIGIKALIILDQKEYDIFKTIY